MIRRSSVTFILLIVLWALTGCYGNVLSYVYVESHEMALHLDKGVNPTKLMGPGQYSDSTLYSDIHLYNAEVKTIPWSDPDLQTTDKQTIGLDLSILVQRPKEQECAFKMYRNYRTALDDDAALGALVQSQVPDIAKAVSSSSTLSELIGRGNVKDELFEKLSLELNEFCITLVDLGVQNVAVSEAYKAVQDAKAQAVAEGEQAKAEAEKARQQLEVTKANNEITLANARTDAAKAVLEAEVFKNNPYALELAQQKIMADAIKPTDKVFFIQPGTGLNLFMGDTAGVVPVPSN